MPSLREFIEQLQEIEKIYPEIEYVEAFAITEQEPIGEVHHYDTPVLYFGTASGFGLTTRTLLITVQVPEFDQKITKPLEDWMLGRGITEFKRLGTIWDGD